MPEKLHRRPGAPPIQGLHVAGVDGEFCDVVESDWPRCPSCEVLYADGIDHGLCLSCERDYESAEDASRRRAELRGDGA